ncbi:MAG: zinc ribbon domain-containing protein [Thermoplasmatota archaeon]
METLSIVIIAILAIAVLSILFAFYYIYFIARKREVEALEVERPGIGRQEMIPFDEDIEEALYKKRVVCPECGEDVDPYDEVCPHCESRMSSGVFECSNCGKEVDPRDKECPHCGDILLPDPFVCPSCGRPVEMDATRCDSCGARFWSPIRLDDASVKKRVRKFEEPKGEESEEESPERGPQKRRSYR